MSGCEQFLKKERLICGPEFWLDRQQSFSPASEIWDPLAETDPVGAAAAGTGDWFIKVPAWIDQLDFSGVLLDAGCGYGRISIPILRRCPSLQVIGVDSSQVMLRHYRSLASETSGIAEVFSRICLVKSDLQNLPIEDGSVDHFITSAVLLHNSRDATRTIVAEMFRCLKPGGEAAFVESFPNVWQPEGLQNLAYAALAGERNGPVRPYTRGSLARLLEPFAEPGSVRIWSERVILLPRTFYRWPFQPYKRAAGWVNQALSGAAFLRRWSSATGILAASWQITCRKRP